jgi:hypothetical protein
VALSYFNNVREDFVNKFFEDKGGHDRRMGNTETFDKDVVDSVEVREVLFFLGDNFVDDALQGSQWSCA